MTLYHGSLEIVEHPLIREANRPLDFGTGFYTTTSLQQARRWVKLRMEQNNVSHGYINRYEYTPQKGLKTRRFQSANEAWVDFVHANRTIQNYKHDYDIVTGPVANDNVYLSFIGNHQQARTYPPSEDIQVGRPTAVPHRAIISHT